jgi:hypothetical protein
MTEPTPNQPWQTRFWLWADRALMANLFLVFFSFAWLAIAVVGRSLHKPLGFDLWYALWQPLWQPALGILMASAILNGSLRWVSRRLSPKD